MSDAYASVARAGDDHDPDRDDAAAPGAGRHDALFSPPSSAAARASRAGAATTGPTRGRARTEPDSAPQSSPRGRAAGGRMKAPRPVVSRKSLMRRAALAGTAIALLSLGLIVTEQDANVPPPPDVAVPTAGAPDDVSSADGVSGFDAAGLHGQSLGAVGAAGETGSTPAESSTPAAPQEAPAAQAQEASEAQTPEEGTPTGEAVRAVAVTDGAGLAPAAAGDTPQAELANAATGTTGVALPASSAAASPVTPVAGAAPAGGRGDTVVTATQAGATALSAAAALPETIESPVPATPSGAPAPAAPPVSASALARGFVVQLGVFSDAANADALSRELSAQGYPAHLQSRVVLGPFADRQAAKAAEERLRRERRLEGIIVSPRKP